MPERLAMQLHSTVLRVADLQRSREFYEIKLGMQVVYQDPHYKLISLEKGGGSRVTLWEMREFEQRTHSTKECAYLVFVAQDARAQREFLAGRGVDVGPIEDYPFGLRMFWISDPDEFRFCVIEFLPE